MEAKGWQAFYATLLMERSKFGLNELLDDGYEYSEMYWSAWKPQFLQGRGWWIDVNRDAGEWYLPRHLGH